MNTNTATVAGFRRRSDLPRKSPAKKVMSVMSRVMNLEFPLNR